MRKNVLKTFATATMLLFAGNVMAQNPIIQTMFTPDPAPFVYNDTVFLFVDHDEDESSS